MKKFLATIIPDSISSGFLIAGIILLTFFQSQAQDYEAELKKFQQKQKKISEDIKFTEKLIKQNKSKESDKINELLIVQEQVRSREKLISNITNEKNTLEKYISDKEEFIKALENDLIQLKQEYGNMIVAAYRNKSNNNKLMFLFSAKGFSDLFKRILYINRYAEYRKGQAKLIAQTKDEIEIKVQKLEKKRLEKQQLLITVSNQKKQLKNESNQLNQLIHSLRSKEKSLKADLNEQKKIADKTSSKIKEIIKLIKENKGLSKVFANNRGKLPWPVKEQYTITKRYGIFVDPVLKTKQQINGIHLATTPGSKARAVFEGTVVSIFSIPGAQQSVIVSHGKYFSVYQHLTNVNVEPGNDVETGQILGDIFTYDEKGKTELVFELWNKDTNSTMNPEQWLRK